VHRNRYWLVLSMPTIVVLRTTMVTCLACELSMLQPPCNT
jgi:hypothetical protein